METNGNDMFASVEGANIPEHRYPPGGYIVHISLTARTTSTLLDLSGRLITGSKDDGETTPNPRYNFSGRAFRVADLRVHRFDPPPP
jgi:hypothetical protein